MQYAILRSKDESKKYKGASMTASLWTPKVLPSEYSSSQMKIRNGQDIIQIGWTVRAINHDHTRIIYQSYIYTCTHIYIETYICYACR